MKMASSRVVPISLTILAVLILLGVTMLRAYDAPATKLNREAAGSTLAGTAPPQPARAAPAPALEPHPLDPQAHAIQAEASKRHSVALNEARWNADPGAPEIAAKLESTVQAAAQHKDIARLLYRPSAMTSNCKANMCRIDAEFAAGSSGGEWLTMMMTLLGPEFASGYNVTEQLSDGQSRELLYIYRPGVPRPQ